MAFDVKHRRKGTIDLFSGIIDLITFIGAVFLGNAEVLTSGWVNVGGFRKLTGAAYSDQAGSFVIQFSTTGEGNEVDAETAAVNVPAGGAGVSFDESVVAEYARVKYTNGATLQTAFRFRLYGRAVA